MPSHSRTTRSYGYQHRKTRARLLPAAIGTHCPGAMLGAHPYRSRNCDHLMTNTARMHLDHTTARALGGTRGDRICCAPCNLGAGAALKNHMHQAATTPPARHTRTW